jgi:hypothetical protein
MMRLTFIFTILLGVITTTELSAKSDVDAITRIEITDAKANCLGLAEKIGNHLSELVDAMSDDDQQYFYITEAARAWELGIFTLRDLSRDYDMYTILDSASSKDIEQRLKVRLLEACQGAIQDKVDRLSGRVVYEVRRRATDIEHTYAVVQMLKMADKLESLTKALPNK